MPPVSGKSANPLQLPLIASGLLFALTACAYAVMALRRIRGGIEPERASQGAWLLDQLDHHGASLLILELIVLAVLAVAAIRLEAHRSRSK